MTGHVFAAPTSEVLALQLLANIGAKLSLFFVFDSETERFNGSAVIEVLVHATGTLASRRDREWIAQLRGSADIDGLGRHAPTGSTLALDALGFLCVVSHQKMGSGFFWFSSAANGGFFVSSSAGF